MKSVVSWFINIAAISFWLFRVVIVLGDTMHWNFPITPLDSSIEIPILFATVICVLLIFKKKLLGAIIYLALYGGYFGATLFGAISNISSLSQKTILDAMISAVAILIAGANLMDILLTTNRTSTKATKKTDWFFDNKQFDRELDERADKNNYRTL